MGFLYCYSRRGKQNAALDAGLDEVDGRARRSNYNERRRISETSEIGLKSQGLRNIFFKKGFFSGRERVGGRKASRERRQADRNISHLIPIRSRPICRQGSHLGNEYARARDWVRKVISKVPEPDAPVFTSVICTSRTHYGQINHGEARTGAWPMRLLFLDCGWPIYFGHFSTFWKGLNKSRILSLEREIR